MTYEEDVINSTVSNSNFALKKVPMHFENSIITYSGSVVKTKI